MNEKYLRKLEFDKIRQRISEKAFSVGAKELADQMAPSTSIFEIRRRLNETEEAFRYVVAKGDPSFWGLTDIRDGIYRSSKGAALTMHEFIEIGSFLSTIARIKEYGQRGNLLVGDFPELDPRFDALVPIRMLEKEIGRCILGDDEMADDASQEMHRIRREISLNENKIQNELQMMIRSETYKTSLQDPIVTMRSGRYCLPVKSQFKGNVTGMVHDQSASGSTVFVEPIAVVKMNNRIAELRSEEQEEIIRILRELGKMVNNNKESILANFTILTEMDFIFARAEYSKELNMVKPKFNEDKYIHIEQARHPLLDQEKVVPISITIGGEYSTLVITGPNTGGKTVSLKTLGLLQIMGQSGLMIPCGKDPELTVLDQVFADIGDEQSIEQSLSTFSSHMVTIVDILKHVTENSLVLFDELGAGTDPTEGAALAQSILDDLKKRSILTVATTHYSELKVYALSTEGVENASCEFNVETLMPTYRLMIGIPGKSNAFAISERLGLPKKIISEAGALLETNDIKFEDMISDLEKRRLEVEKEQKEINRLRRELTALKSDISSQKNKLEQQKEQILTKARKEAKEYLQKAKAEADYSISRVNKLIKDGSVDMSALEKERTSLREKANEIKEPEVNTEYPDLLPVRKKDLIPGTQIMLKGFDQEYSVLCAPDDRDKLQVQAGIMKMQIKLSDIAGILEDAKPAFPKKSKPKTDTTKGAFGKSRDFHIEVDLRGLMTVEGIEVLDKYIDDACLAGMEQVRVIHGKGTGAMRKAVHQYLKKASQVKSFRLGEYGEGDSGVTIVELKKH